jgi:acylphosphatase
MNICRQCIVRGRVQGVAFRAHTQRHARELGVTGYAKNLSDGTVEVLACGAESSVAALCDWLRVGPPAARVTDVSCADAARTDTREFVTF